MTTEQWILILCAAGVLLLAAVALRVFLGGKNETGAAGMAALRHTMDETRADVEKMRRDLIDDNEAVRSGVANTLGDLSRRTEAFTRQSYDTQLRVTESLARMQEKITESGSQNAAAVAAAVEKLQASNEKKLDEMRAAVDERLGKTLSDRLDTSFQTVSEQLANVYRSLGEMREISGGISSLNRVLAGVKTRGNWAETQLESLLEQIIPGMYEKNFAPAGSGDVVEFAVRIPSADGDETLFMPIDSKFPMEDYLRLCEASDAGDAEAVRAARKALEARILSEAKDVRKYIVPPVTTPFAVLYLATDSLYAEAVSSKANLADRLHTEYRVLLAGPSTITALLSSLAIGFRSVALNRKADEVMKLLAAAKAQYDKFEETLTSAQRSIEAAGKKLDDAKHRNDVIRKNLRNVETLGEGEPPALLEE